MAESGDACVMRLLNVAWLVLSHVLELIVHNMNQTGTIRGVS